MLTDTVRQHMDVAPQCLRPELSLSSALEQMNASGFDALPVIEAEDRLAGFVTAQDLLRQLWLNDYQPVEGQLVSDVMRRDVALVSPELSMRELAESMTVDIEKLHPVNSHGLLVTTRVKPLAERLEEAQAQRPKNYPVVENGKLVGVIRRQQVLAALAAGLLAN